MARLRSAQSLVVASSQLLLLSAALSAGAQEAQPSQPVNYSTPGIASLPAVSPQQSTPPAAPTPSQLAAIPDGSAPPEQLEAQGDQLRSQKRFLDAIDYYNVAIKKQPTAILYNKVGMSYLLLQRRDPAAKAFDKAIKTDKHDASGYNNRGYIEQMKQKYDSAIKYYTKAIKLRDDDAVFHYNIAASYFAKHDYKTAAREYKVAFDLDPNIFNRVSKVGVMAQATSPEDRAAFSFMVAKMYAQAGDVEHSIEYLRKAMENGYKDIKRVYTDTEFAGLRTDKRFEELMAERPQAIQ